MKLSESETKAVSVTEQVAFKERQDLKSLKIAQELI